MSKTQPRRAYNAKTSLEPRNVVKRSLPNVATLLFTLLVIALPWSAHAGEELTLDDVLQRATNNVRVLFHQLSSVVAEELYTQKARKSSTALIPESRTLRSDYLLIRPKGAERPYGFRDVFEVDGRPVRDRANRLTRLFLDPSVSSDQQIQGILNESARYNVGAIKRTVNTPTLPLIFLSENHRPRFQFAHTTNTKPELKLEGLELPADIWVIMYQEEWPTTVVRGRDGKLLPSEGRFWIEPRSGRVLISELLLDDGYWVSTIVVRYAPDVELGHLVPVEMRERYNHLRQGGRIEGTATYTHFRRFQVVVDEIQPN